MKAAILCDSSAYLKHPLKDKENIFQVDFTLVLPDGEVITESTDENHLDTFFKTWMTKDTGQPKTSQPNIQDYHDRYEEIIKAGYDTVFGVYLSSGVSGTFNTAELVSEEYRDRLNIYNLDAVGLSVNMEQIILQISTMIEQGLEAESIIKNAQTLMSDSRFFICLETNDNLIKGGRGEALTQYENQALKTRSVLEYVPETTPEVRHLLRTNKQVIKTMTDIGKEFRSQHPNQNLLISIGHTLSEEKAKELAENLQDALDQTVDLSIIGTAFCSHLGKGALSVGFMPTYKEFPHD